MIRGKIRGTIREVIRGVRDGRGRKGDLGEDHIRAHDPANAEAEASRRETSRHDCITETTDAFESLHFETITLPQHVDC